MPNYVANVVKMDGITKLPLFREEFDGRCFDFNKLIPMPESLKITAGSIENLAVEAALRKLKKSYSPMSNIQLSNMPDKEYENRIKSNGKSVDELEEMGLQYISNKLLYGHSTWYDWSIENWGTKWNALEGYEIDENTISFNTAWSSPETIFIMLSEKYPDKFVEHWWADEDIGNNSGYEVYQNGEIIYGGYNEPYSTEAYNTYVKCWRESDCLYMDKEGNLNRKDCSECDCCG